ncbi:DUF6355 family natural product biosynthesis protein [Allokutzneria albata]|uniref:Uncharacterized protein n=1 Tax=Allokutzneria albata TaxID=211114 RepID=A0A1G9SHG6_ALLAB|nr:DUF6355 family natural product biosynthesis protein [Allokutzneria albata]SDM34841.1 hypothetical protein SAMN04489726_1177 [Allokutzneria albata]
MCTRATAPSSGRFAEIRRVVVFSRQPTRTTSFTSQGTRRDNTRRIAPVGDIAKLEKCGFDPKGTPAVQAWYNHCGSGNVRIRIDRFIGDNTFQCVGPGLTLLGVWPDFYDAWYDNRTC